MKKTDTLNCNMNSLSINEAGGYSVIEDRKIDRIRTIETIKRIVSNLIAIFFFKMKRTERITPHEAKARIVINPNVMSL